MRSDSRTADESRPIRVEFDVQPHADGSVLMTIVLFISWYAVNSTTYNILWSTTHYRSAWDRGAINGLLH